jgi:hypothetical protein
MGRFDYKRPGDEQTLEGGGGGGGYSSATKSKGLSINAQATRNSDKNNTSIADEQIRLSKLMQVKKEIADAKAKPERQAAERNAKTTSEDGVKKTEYPYAGPNEYAKGGSVSARADGIAQRGKTKGRMC